MKIFREFLTENNQKFDFIDLDPFGSPSKYLSSALHAIKDGGMLAVSATDLRHLCTSPSDSLIKYGAVTFNGGTCSNEMVWHSTHEIELQKNNNLFHFC